MKILIMAPFGEGYLADSYKNAFMRLGHEVICFDTDEAYFTASKFAANRYLRRIFRKYHWERVNYASLQIAKTVKPNLTITFKGAYLNPETIREITKNYGIPFINYYPDNPYCGVPLNPYKTSTQRRDLIDCLKEYTHVFIWSPRIVERLKKDSVISSYLPFAADTDFYNASLTPSNNNFRGSHKIVLIGQRNNKRESHIYSIKKYSVDLWGRMWERSEKKFKERHIIHSERAFGRDCSVLYKNADVSLNIVDDLNMPGHNMRTFEIPASKGLMLSVYTEEQNAIFPEGEAAFYYRDPKELDVKIEFILNNPTIAKKVRNKGYLISQEHTYTKRAAEMLEVIEKM